MKRIVKKPDVRRMEIILIAKKQFEQKGYANTSVESIIQEVGIAKGTFYHYFKAKKDILQAIVEYIGSEMESLFRSIVENNNLTAIEKLQLMIRGPKKKVLTESPVMEILHKGENRELQEQLNILTIEHIAPLMAQVFEQGKQEGVFARTVPVESIQLMLGGSQFVMDSGLFNWSNEKRTAFLKSAQTMLEMMVGAKPGTFSFILEE